MDTPTDAIVTSCGHTFCRECIVNVLNGPCVVDEENPKKYKGNERPCRFSVSHCGTLHTDEFLGPSCRSAISADRIFVREAFEPQDDDLAVAGPSRFKVDTNCDTLDVSEDMVRDPKGKGKAKKRLRKKRSAYDSDCDDDDLSDFIVEDGEDEEEKDASRELKRLKRKRMIVESDDDIEEDERGTVLGQPDVATAEVKIMSRFLPSTKMKVWGLLYENLSDSGIIYRK